MKSFVKIILVLLLLTSCQNREDETFIVPKDYQGYVIVLYNQKDGVKPKYEGGKRVYEIPESGVLKTQFSSSYGYASKSECYISSIDANNKLKVSSLGKDLSKDEVIACCFSTGKSYKNSDNEAVEYLKFYVGTKNQIDVASESFEKLHVANLVDN